MSRSLENGQEYTGQSVSGVFHEAVQRLLHDNIELVLSKSLSPQRNVELLHLIDPSPQPGQLIDYHVVYQSFDSETQANTHGLYLANPWIRSIRMTECESRHYFDGGENLVVREDSRADTQEFEFLRGAVINPLEAEHLEYGVILMNFHSDIDRIRRSQSLRPMSLLFNRFARLK